MIEVTRSRWIRATPQTLFAILANPVNLAGMLPRVRQVDVLEQHADWARIATHMAFEPFGTIRNEGEARWQTDREVQFVSRKPVLVYTRWSLEPNQDGTTVTAQLQLDLAPLLGPLAAFVPPAQVIGMVVPELDAALVELESRVANTSLQS